MARPWTIREYEALFRENPPTKPQQSAGQTLANLAKDLKRNPGVVSAQWADARSAVLSSETEASAQLIGYLRREGLI
jgi:hypothetical protein